MYTKLFGTILDSSVWMQPDPTRLVWITLLAAMDQDGFTRFGNVEALAHRARVSIEDCRSAVAYFEAPEPGSATEDDDGRRIERVPGGWMILSSDKYREMASREDAREATRERVARHRLNKRRRGGKGHSDPGVTDGNEKVTGPSVSVSDSSKSSPDSEMPDLPDPVEQVFQHWQTTFEHPQAQLDKKRRRVIEAALKHYDVETLKIALTGYTRSAHHMGENDRHTRYDDVELFLRDAKHIDAGLAFARGPELRTGEKPGAGAAREAWGKVVQHVRRGAWRNGGLGDRIDAAIKEIGGYQKIAMSDESRLSFVEREFAAAYKP